MSTMTFKLLPVACIVFTYFVVFNVNNAVAYQDCKFLAREWDNIFLRQTIIVNIAAYSVCVCIVWLDGGAIITTVNVVDYNILLAFDTFKINQFCLCCSLEYIQ